MNITELTQLLETPCGETTASLLSAADSTTFRYAFRHYLMSDVRTREARRYCARCAIAVSRRRELGYSGIISI